MIISTCPPTYLQQFRDTYAVLRHSSNTLGLQQNIPCPPLSPTLQQFFSISADVLQHILTLMFPFFSSTLQQTLHISNTSTFRTYLQQSSNILAPLLQQSSRFSALYSNKNQQSTIVFSKPLQQWREVSISSNTSHQHLTLA